MHPRIKFLTRFALIYVLYATSLARLGGLDPWNYLASYAPARFVIILGPNL